MNRSWKFQTGKAVTRKGNYRIENYLYEVPFVDSSLTLKKCQNIYLKQVIIKETD